MVHGTLQRIDASLTFNVRMCLTLPIYLPMWHPHNGPDFSVDSLLDKLVPSRGSQQGQSLPTVSVAQVMLLLFEYIRGHVSPTEWLKRKNAYTGGPDMSRS